jgi:rare lipoprotein A
MLVGCKHVQAPSTNVYQTGVASWYGVPFNGRPTASGEIFDMQKLTAAHRTLPLGTVVNVLNLTNQQTVQVRINDRGPFVADRIIDLSQAAAKTISMPGISNVNLSIVSSPPTRGVENYAVQVGNFTDKESAEKLRQSMEAKYGTASVVFRPLDQSWRVLVGLEPTAEGAEALLKKIGPETQPGFVVMVDSEQ